MIKELIKYQPEERKSVKDALQSQYFLVNFYEISNTSTDFKTSIEDRYMKIF